ncbi:MAG TPA: hypothetical protein VKT78_01400, partial [Fimbriimonadaceae bacterium]|nr:hypothetical protein [Fimbriimonadaceae bacterium]
DFPGAKVAELDWDGSTSVNFEPSENETYMQDELYVKNRRFNHDVDLSKDPTMYPCAHENYIIEFYYSPRMAPPHIQDKFSWNGEGMLDSNFSNTEVRAAREFTYTPFPMTGEDQKNLAPLSIKSPGQRVMYTTLTLTKDQLLRRGEWAVRTPSVQTKNYKQVESGGSGDEIIKVPTLRGGK